MSVAFKALISPTIRVLNTLCTPAIWWGNNTRSCLARESLWTHIRSSTPAFEHVFTWLREFKKGLRLRSRTAGFDIGMLDHFFYRSIPVFIRLVPPFDSVL